MAWRIFVDTVYEYITGKLTLLTPIYGVLEASGIGYRLEISLFTHSSLQGRENTDVRLLLHHVVREDAQQLYAFGDEEERSLFRHLIGVSGIGPGTARTALSSTTPSDLRHAIISGNLALVKRGKGIGPKVAQRLITELADTLKRESYSGPNLSMPLSASDTPQMNEALAALLTLGFTRLAAERTLARIQKEQGTELSVEDLIRQSLKTL